MQDQTKELPKNIKEILSALKESPAFAMSRGGRELFHTNFIAFILEQTTDTKNQKAYVQTVKEAFLSSFFGKNAPKNVLVLREKSNLDLIVIPVDDMPQLILDKELDGLTEIKENELNICVVEAKLKSIPTLEQLDRYSKKLKNSLSIDLHDDDSKSKLVIKTEKQLKVCNTLTIKSNSHSKTFQFKKINFKCLLLAPESFLIKALDDPKNKNTWSNLSWESLLSNLEKNSESHNNDESLKLDVFVSDYILSTQLVVELISIVTKYVDDFMGSASSITLNELYNFTTHSSFKKLKLHDLVGKVAYEYLAKKIFESLKIEIKNKSMMSYLAFMTNSTPGFQVEFNLSDGKNESGIGVQLQGRDYRHYVRRNFIDENNPLLELITDDNSLAEWIKSDENKGKGDNQFKKFHVDKFLYKSRNVEDLKYDDLCQAIENSLKMSEPEKFLKKILSGK